jgi:hypothetical protein
MKQIIEKIYDSYEKLIIENYEEHEYTKRYRNYSQVIVLTSISSTTFHI